MEFLEYRRTLKGLLQTLKVRELDIFHPIVKGILKCVNIFKIFVSIYEKLNFSLLYFFLLHAI